MLVDDKGLQNFEKNVADADVSILMTNKKGGYAFFSVQPLSRYEGVFSRFNGKMIKLIESIIFPYPVTAITNRLWCVSMKRNELLQNLFMPLHHDALVIELGASSEFELVLDVKISEDNRVWGRNYEVSCDDHTLVVKFSKSNDGRDDNSVFNSEFGVYLAVYSPELEYQPLQCWEEHFYKTDEARNSPPFSRWVFKACKLRAKNAVFAWAEKKDVAISTAKNVFDDQDRLRRERELYVNSLVSNTVKIKNPEISLAAQCAINSLDSLILDNDCIVAGLPWFYQYWARDEIICAKALMLQKNFSLAKKVLFKYFSKLTSEGLLPNIFDRETDLLAFDAVGWLFFRCKELLDLCARKKPAILSNKDKELIVEKLKTSLNLIFKNRFADNLMQAKLKETWMDTEYGGDSRAGAPIEVQAFVLFMLKLLRKLTGRVDHIESELLENVRKNFLKNKLLVDVAGKQVVRPNIFIAAYIYPELLSKNEWEDCFDSVLPKLWLDWGGLSTIDKKNSLFTENYSGEDNKSYHRGDSWFWLNNLSAIVLHRINPKKFEQYISKILLASTNEILYKGATGFAAEVSSAKELSSNGCVAQAWSSALFIELVDELFAEKNKSR